MLDAHDLALSVQVLQEFYVQATRTDRLTHEQAIQLVEAWLRFPVQDVTVALMLAAAATTERYGISYWDAATIEAARTADARWCCRRVSPTAAISVVSASRTRSGQPASPDQF